jgi:sugar lactone lactonase YvrE
MNRAATAERFADGLEFAECPRWHDGALWISDMWGHTVYRFDPDGARHTVHDFGPDEDPGGLGWLPDGRLLVVGMEGRRLYRLEADGPVVHADLAELAPWPCNDMIVADDGTAYVSQFGFDLWGASTLPATSPLIRVWPDGRVDAAAHDLMVPNGVALTAEGRTMIVAESGAFRLVRFTVREDGTLTDRETFAELTPAPGADYAPPDGICLDEAGAVWAADPIGNRVVRIEAGGRVEREITFDLRPLAAVLGGTDRRTLFVCLAAEYGRLEHRSERDARIDAVRVDIPGAGRP